MYRGAAGIAINWLQVLGTTERSQIHQRVRQQLHAIVPLLDAFKAEQQPFELIGRVADLHFTVSYQQSKLVAIDQQPDDEVMHLGRSGKADLLPHEAFDPGAQRQVLPLYVLRVALAQLGRIRIEMTRVGAPRVRIIPCDAKRFQQGFALQTYLIFAAPQDVRQDVTTAVIHRVPEPPRCLFLAHVGPHLINFHFLGSLDHYVHLVRMSCVEQRSVHRGERTFFFSRMAN